LSHSSFFRSGLVVFVVAAVLSGCERPPSLFSDSPAPFPARKAHVANNPAPIVDNTVVAPAETHRPGLVVTDTPAPDVIYRAGSHDTVLASNNAVSFPPVNTSHMETLVTQKARDLGHELDQLRNATDNANDLLQELRSKNDKAAADYYAAVAVVSTELEGGTTRGNPILVDRWNVAQEKLNALSQESGRLTDLASDLSNQASRASYLLDSTQNAFSISGAVPEDHKKLTSIQDGVEQTISLINRLLSKTNDEINRRATYLQSERANLQTLALGIANGELYGKNLTNSLFTKTVEGDRSLRGDASGVPGMRKPLVIIRFDRPNVNYEQALYTAVHQALDKYPTAKFDLVAVSNLEGNAAQLALASQEARKNAEMVLRSLQNMGLPVERVRLSAASSKNVLNSEVHLYLQ
jgi:hypothetical protein